MKNIPHYGLHFAAGDVGFLIQNGPAQSIYPDLPCPFNLRRMGYEVSCPHGVELSEADSAGREIFADPLASWFANPTGIALVLDTDRRAASVASQLSQLYSPTRPALDFAWTLRQRIWRFEAEVTNLSPWVLVGADVKCVNYIRSITTRPVLLLAAENIPLPPNSFRLSTDLTESDLEPLALGQLGAWAVSRRLRRERVTAA